MSKVSFVVDPYFQKDLIFDRHQTRIPIRDQALDKYYALYDAFKVAGFDIATDDINPIEGSEIVIYTDMPKRLPTEAMIDKSYLVMMESPLVRPDDFELEKHRYFHKLFTWSDPLVDGVKYIKFHYAFTIPDSIPKRPDKKKLCCLIVGNKSSSHPDELYSERRAAIRWFEQHHPEAFTLYGTGWDEHTFTGPRLLRAFNRIPIVKKAMFRLLHEPYPSYRGRVVNKYATMQEYRFAIAYENIKDQEGYITEKIFDAFFAGCVPIYLGASNITDYVPKECFIDKRAFATYEELYRHMTTMDEDSYLGYLERIEAFLKSRAADPFRVESFAKTIVDTVVDKREG